MSGRGNAALSPASRPASSTGVLLFAPGSFLPRLYNPWGKTSQGESCRLLSMNEFKSMHQASTGLFFSPALSLFSPPGASGGRQLQGAPVPTATSAAAQRPGDASSCPRGFCASRGSGRGCRGTRRRVAEAALGSPSPDPLPRPTEKAKACSGRVPPPEPSLGSQPGTAYSGWQARSRPRDPRSPPASPGTSGHRTPASRPRNPPRPRPWPPPRESRTLFPPLGPPPDPGPTPPRGPPIATCSPAAPATPTLR